MRQVNFMARRAKLRSFMDLRLEECFLMKGRFRFNKLLIYPFQSVIFTKGKWIVFRLSNHIKDPAGSAIPIVAVTANAIRGSCEAALESGFDAYLSKPVDEDALLEVLERYLGGNSVVR